MVIVLFFFIALMAVSLGMWLAFNKVEPVRNVQIPHSLVLECKPLYDTGRHREWAACMGVTYR
jgi:hypothetical protein